MPLRMTEYEVKQLLGTAAGAKQRKPKPLKPQGYPLTTRLAFELPWPPLNNQTWRHVGGKTILSAAARRYRKTIEEYIRINWPVGVPKPINSRLFAVMVTHPGHHVPYDIDGTQKSVFDALEKAGVYLNDSQIDGMFVVKGTPSVEDPRIDIILMNYDFPMECVTFAANHLFSLPCTIG